MNPQEQYCVFSTTWGYFGFSAEAGRIKRTCLPCQEATSVEQTLLHAPSRGQTGKSMLDTERQQVHEALRRIEYHFTDNIPRT